MFDTHTITLGWNIQRIILIWHSFYSPLPPFQIVGCDEHMVHGLTKLTAVLASCTAGAWSTMEGLWQVVWVWNGELVGHGHRPGGSPGMGQRGESVLI